MVVAPDAVLVEEMRFADGSVQTTWTWETTGAMRMLQVDADGNPGFEQSIGVYLDGSVNPDGFTAHETDMDHQTREYQSFPPHPADGIVSRGDELLAREIESGALVADGTEAVEGVELLRFVAPTAESDIDCERSTDPDLCEQQHRSSTNGPTSRVVWADPTTRRPVKEHTTGGIGGYTVTYTYLADTPENLSLLDSTFPRTTARGQISVGASADACARPCAAR